MANQVPEEQVQDQNQEQQKGQQGGGKKEKGILIDYSLTPILNNVIFTLHKQDPRVTRFLEKVGTFHASNGVSVTLGLDFPEWVVSVGLIKLDGTNGERLERPDNSAFAIERQDIQRKAIKGFHLAIEELVDAVRKAYSYDEAPTQTYRVKL